MMGPITFETPLPEQRLLGERARWLTLAGLYAIAAGAVWSPPLVSLGQVLLLALVMMQASRLPWVFLRSGLFWLAVVFVVYVVVRGAVAAVERPDLAALHWEGVSRWVRAGPLTVFIVAVGFAVTGRRRLHIPAVLLTALVVFTLDLLLRLEPERLLAALQPAGTFEHLEFGKHGRRYVFDRHFAFMSLLYSLALMGLTALGTVAAWRWRSRPRRWLPITTGVVLFVGFYATALIAGGARASWLATLAGLGVMAGAAVFHGRARLFSFARTWRRSAAALAVVLGLTLSIFGTVVGERVAGRLAKFGDRPEMALEVVTGERALADMPTGSVGIRLAYYVFGLQRIAERPLFGYGPGRPRHLVFDRKAPPQINNRQTHFHSQYLDVPLRFGLLGFAAVVAPFVLAVRGIWRGWRDGRIGGEYVVFMLGAVTVYAIWSFADTRFANYTMVAIVSLILGAGCSFLLVPGENHAHRRPGGPTDGDVQP